MEGRDIGTVVLPDADSLYSSAIKPTENSAAPRALNNIAERDAKDSSRKIAPLEAAATLFLSMRKPDIDGVQAT